MEESHAVKNDAMGKLTQREEMEILAQTHGLMLIPEFDFEHCIYPHNWDEFNL